MRQPIDLAERKHLPATLGESPDRLMENRKFVRMINGLGNTGPLLYHGQTVNVS